MGINLKGVLPVSALNVALVAALPALNAEIAKLTGDIGDFQNAIVGQFTAALNFPPPLPAVASGIAAQIANLDGLFDPANLVNASGDIALDGAVELGILNIALALVGEIGIKLNAGLDIGGISLWTYAGRAAGFGDQLVSQTQLGYPGVAASDVIQAVIVETESFDSWGNFSATFNTGDTAQVNPADAVRQEDLKFLGTLRGEQLNTGTLEAVQPINLFLDELEAAKVNLELQLQAALGLNLPNLTELLDVLVNVDVQLLVENLVDVNVDLAVDINLLQIKIDVLLALIANIEGSLSAGGLACWTYGGPASGLGLGLQSELTEGIPGGSGPDVPGYGIVMATKLPAVWATFGLIFGVA